MLTLKLSYSGEGVLRFPGWRPVEVVSPHPTIRRRQLRAILLRLCLVLIAIATACGPQLVPTGAPPPPPTSTPLLAVTSSPQATLTAAPQPTPLAAPATATKIYLPMTAVASLTGQGSQEWPQDGHDPQRTGFVNVEPALPWSLLWTWDGPDANGGSGNHFYDAPPEARVVAGGGQVYAPAGTHGLYALSAANGQVDWNLASANFSGAVAYDPANNLVFAGSANGQVYKIDARSGAVMQTYLADGPVNRGVLLVGAAVFALTDGGHLHKINTADMSRAWVYVAGSAAGNGLAYSATRDVIIFGTDDLYLHAVRNSNGQAKWRVKPTPNPAGFPNQYLWFWPVVADQHGVVFVRMQLDWHAALWGYPGVGSIWPNTNAETRAFLVQHPSLQNLFALNLDDGTPKFIPAVGDGGVEIKLNGQPGGPVELTTDALPVVKVLPDGTEVAYMVFRNGQSSPPDGRWDSNMGEMVLDDHTVPGMVAGDLRFIRMSIRDGGSSYIYLTDEQTPVTLAGNTILHAHWGASEAVQITDRSNARGLTYANPIETRNLPTVIRRMTACPDKNTVTHYTTCTLNLFGDTRGWSGPGWWTYWNADDPAQLHDAPDTALRPKYTFVSGSLMIVEGNGGELMVFRHS